MQRLLLWLLVIAIQGVQASPQVIIGKVIDVKSFKALYIEKHRIDGDRHLVAYQVNSQRPFATKQLQSTTDMSRADTEFQSERCGEAYQVSPITVGKDSDTIRIRYRNDCDKKEKDKTLSIKKPYVIDAGFSVYIAETLFSAHQTRLVFYYPLPSRQQVVRLQAKVIACEKIKTVYAKLLENRNPDEASERWQYCAIVKPKQWLLAQFFPPIYLAYDAKKQLAFYAGRSNMSDQKNSYPDIAIFYAPAIE